MSDLDRPRRMPLTIAIFLHSLLGGVGGGVVVGLGIMIFGAIQSGGRDWVGLGIAVGAYAGFIVGAAIGVLAALLRAAVLIFTSAIRWQVVAVVIAAVIAPVAVLSIMGASGLAWFGLIVGGLAGLHLGRLVSKRLRRDRAESAGDPAGVEPAP